MNKIKDDNLVEWSTIPVINEISSYLDKSNTISLSQACKYFRLKLSDRIFFEIVLFNQSYIDYRDSNRTTKSVRKIKTEVCKLMIDDLAYKYKLVKKVVLNYKISAKLANLFFEKFKYCKIIILDSLYDNKLSTVYNILKHLKYLEVVDIMSVYETDPKNTLPPPDFKFPTTLKSISVSPYIQLNNFIPAINEINFSTYKNVVSWLITGEYNIDRFFTQQANIIHLSIRDFSPIELNRFKLAFENNPQLITLSYALDVWSVEKFNAILKLPNLKKLKILNYSFKEPNIAEFDLISNNIITTLILDYKTPRIIIEFLLKKLESLKDIVFTSWKLGNLSAINWLQYKGKFNSITFGYSHWKQMNYRIDQFNCLLPETKIIFNNKLKYITNYDLSI
jgi:hypothetical protein